jgi:hypothetical protein
MRYSSFAIIMRLNVLLSIKKGTKIYTGGLDTSADAVDGRFGVLWEDSSSGTIAVYHAATLMPTDISKDPRCSLKKRHIGNDVGISWY